MLCSVVSLHRSAFANRTASRRELLALGTLVLALSLIVALGISRGLSGDRLEGEGTNKDYASFLDDTNVDGLPLGLERVWEPLTSPKPLSGNAQAIRIGALIVDVEVAASARNAVAEEAYRGDSAAIAAVRHQSAYLVAFTSEVLALLANQRGTNVASDMFARTKHKAQTLATIDINEIVLGRQASLVFRPRMIALGNWLEAARIAALRGDREFFQEPAVSSGVQSLASVKVTPPAQEALDRVWREMPEGQPRDLAALERALTEALRVLAN